MSEVYLVTGVAGFIGSNIVERLVKEGKKVKGIDNFITGRKENIQPFLPHIEFVEGDIRDPELVYKLMKGVDYVLHQAAIPSVPKSIKNPLKTNDANVTGTLNILVAARDAGIKRLIYASSSSIYGNSPILPKKENMPPNPLSPYAVSKYAGELYCKVFYQIYGLKTVILRYFNVFGPRQDPNSQYAAVIPKFIIALLNRDSQIIYGDGTQTRDFTYVENVVQANLLACKAKDATGEVFNIGCNEGTSVNTLADILADMIGRTNHFVYTAARPGEVKHSLADITKANSILGYKVKVSVREGLKKVVEWYRKR